MNLRRKLFYFKEERAVGEDSGEKVELFKNGARNLFV